MADDRAQPRLDVPSPGLREELVTRQLASELASIAARVELRELTATEGVGYLRQYAARVAAEALDAKESGDLQTAFINDLIGWGLPTDRAEDIALLSPLQLLRDRAAVRSGLERAALPERPQIPLTMNELLVNDRKQPSIGSQLLSELQSAETVELLCAFVIYSGVSTMLDELRRIKNAAATCGSSPRPTWTPPAEGARCARRRGRRGSRRLRRAADEAACQGVDPRPPARAHDRVRRLIELS